MKLSQRNQIILELFYMNVTSYFKRGAEIINILRQSAEDLTWTSESERNVTFKVLQN
jgi:hypothetical protein